MDEKKPENKTELSDSDLNKVRKLSHEMVVALEEKISKREVTPGQCMGALMIAAAAFAKTIGIPDDMAVGAMEEALQLMTKVSGAASFVRGIFSRPPKGPQVPN